MNILILDDAKVIRSLLKLTLESSDYEVDTSKTVAQALELAKSKSYDLIIVDYMLEDNHIGLELIRQLNEDNLQPNTPCIVLSAEQMKEHQPEAEDLGIKAWMKKPFTPIGILQTVEKVLAQSKATESP